MLLRRIGNRFVVIAACILLGACNSAHRAAKAEASSQIPEPVQHLQTQLNTGACEAIYAEAGENFRRQTLTEWRRQCAVLKSELGSWKTFQLKETRQLSFKWPVVLRFSGTAETGNLSRDLAATWLFSERPQLLSIEIQGEKGWSMIPDLGPPPPIKGPLLSDPPLRPPARPS